MAKLKLLKVAVDPDTPCFGVDGVTHELQIGDSCFMTSRFTWWSRPPEPWKELAAVAEQVRAEVTGALAEASDEA